MGDIYGFGTPVDNGDGTYTVSQKDAEDWVITAEKLADMPARITSLKNKELTDHASEFQALLTAINNL